MIFHGATTAKKLFQKALYPLPLAQLRAAGMGLELDRTGQCGQFPSRFHSSRRVFASFLLVCIDHYRPQSEMSRNQNDPKCVRKACILFESHLCVAAILTQ